LATAIVANALLAAEVTGIRFGKTQQRARLVIESDQPVSAVRSWNKNKLVIEISGISKRPTNRLISVGALSTILKLDFNSDSQLLTIVLPVSKSRFIKYFKLAANTNKPERLIIDWNPSPVKIKAKKTVSQQVHVKAKVLVKSTSSGRVLPSARLEALKKQAQDALTDKKFPLAISLLTKLFKTGNYKDKEFAVEFLGVARERNYQLAFAKQYYERFIRDYPDSKSIPRVKQRLSALKGIQDINKKKTLSNSRRRTNFKKSNVRGSLSSDYRASNLINDAGESRQTLSLLGVDANVRGDYDLDDGSNLRFNFSGGHYQDFLPGGKSTNDRLRYANVTWKSSDGQYQVDAGRQRNRGKGIFGRFDGVVVGYAIDDKQTQKVNVVIGAPVASSKVIGIDPERSFVGVSYDWEDILDGLDTSFFLINQTIGSFVDRRAIGGEARYLIGKTSLFSLIDYDIFYGELNALMLSGSHTMEDKTRIYLSYNQSKTPYISTRNALIGQPADSLAELQNLFLTDEEILDLAADRSLESKTTTLQISRPLSKQYDLSGSITSLQLSGAPASGGVAAIAQQGNQLYFNLYLRGSHLYSKGDSNQAGVRISQLSRSDVWSIYASSQYRWNKYWTANAKLRFDNRQNHDGGGQKSISPSIRLQYQNREEYIYLDFGAILYTNKVAGVADFNTDIIYTYLGYRRFF